MEAACERYELEVCDEVRGVTEFGCENTGWKQAFLKQMGVALVFNDADEMCLSFVPTSDGGNESVPAVDYVTGGWVCSQNASSNPNREIEKEHTTNAANQTGSTLLMFCSAVHAIKPKAGFGENAQTSGCFALV